MIYDLYVTIEMRLWLAAVNKLGSDVSMSDVCIELEDTAVGLGMWFRNSVHAFDQFDMS